MIDEEENQSLTPGDTSKEESKAYDRPSPSAASAASKTGKDSEEPPTRNVHTIVEQDMGEFTEKEQMLMDADWSDFKNDVSMKTLVNTLDRAIKRRRRLYISDDPTETEYIANFRK